MKKKKKVLNLLGKFKIFQMISKYFEFSAEFPCSQDIIKEQKFQINFCHSIFIHTLVLPINKQYYIYEEKILWKYEDYKHFRLYRGSLFSLFFLFCSIKKSSRREKNENYSKLVNSSSEEDQHVTSTKAYTFLIFPWNHFHEIFREIEINFKKILL